MAFIIRDGDICCLDSAVVYHFRWYRGAVYYYRGVVYYYGEVVYQTKISSAWKVLLPWLLTFLSPRKEQRACATSGLWLVSEALPPKSPFFLLPSPPSFNCSLLRCQWTVYAYMKERGLSKCHKIKLNKKNKINKGNIRWHLNIYMNTY